MGIKLRLNPCPIFEEHEFNYSAELSGVDKSVWSCICGEQQVEFEDAGTGA